MIRFSQVSKVYPGRHQALQKVDFELKQGEMAFLTGHSGAGKSTLLRLAMAMERVSAGQIEFAGKDITRLAAHRIPFLRRQIGIVFQDYKLLNDRSVLDNVALPLVIEGYAFRDIKPRVLAALDKVGLRDKYQCLPAMLSGGEQQRVGIARAVVNKPTLLIADEPTGNLDPQLSEEILKIFSEFNHNGVTVLVATHDLGLISRMNYRTLTLHEGRLVDSQEQTL
ncbi:cell division ATP-binding protein FtsE [Celerinatantimonas yamalensis]|uniref:Cell division ATP-binding protein FtsE n=1 Tax=Celerinatantimonas yamalensis TaxID=559956 RepID=A0ABW9G799_9GAMM